MEGQDQVQVTMTPEQYARYSQELQKRAQSKPVITYAGAVLAFIGAALVVVGSLLPWAGASVVLRDISTAGTSEGGVWTLIGGVIMVLGVILLIAYEKPDPGALLIAAAGLGCLIFGIYKIAEVNSSTYEMAYNSVPADVGIGLYLLVAGAAIGILGGLTAAVRDKKK